MKINFDTLIDRAGTDSAKWETIQSEANAYIHVHTDKFTGEYRATPMWIADMDFAAPPAVVEAITARAQHPIYGYTELPLTYNRAVADWMQTRHNWPIQPDWIVTTPGVVPALAMMACAFLQPGDKAILQPPVYYPFKVVLDYNDIEIINNPLIYENGSYRMDFDHLAAQASDPRAKLLILSSPHNPVGRVWTRDELTRLAEICRANNVLVISDEIHADLTFVPFVPFGTLVEEFTQNAVICTAASKTFNLAGLSNSNIIIPNPNLRTIFEKYLGKNALLGAHLFGHIATEAAYTHCANWLDQLLEYLSGTLDFMEKYITENIPQIRMIRPQGTYLVWLDCRALGMDSATLTRFFLDRARVYLENGAIFGTGGDGFLRMNIATPRQLVEEALERMRDAVSGNQ